MIKNYQQCFTSKDNAKAFFLLISPEVQTKLECDSQKELMNQRIDVITECKKCGILNRVSNVLKKLQVKQTKNLRNASVNDDPCKEIAMVCNESAETGSTYLKKLKYQHNKEMILKVAKIKQDRLQSTLVTREKTSIFTCMLLS